MLWAKKQRERDQQNWQKEKAAVIERARTQREEDKISIVEMVRTTQNLEEELSTEQNENRSLARQLLVLKTGLQKLPRQRRNYKGRFKSWWMKKR